MDFLVSTSNISMGGSFASTGRKYAFLRRRERADRLGNVLFNSLLQLLGDTVYIPVPTVAVACEVIHHIAFL